MFFAQKSVDVRSLRRRGVSSLAGEFLILLYVMPVLIFLFSGRLVRARRSMARAIRLYRKLYPRS